MENVSVYDTNIEVQSLDLESLKQNFNNYDIKKINIGYFVQIGDSRQIHYTDEDHPITYSANNSFIGDGLLIFDEKFYLNNKNDVDNLLIQIIKNTKESWFSIDSTFVKNNDFIKALCENPNIERIIINNFILTKEIYDLVKQYNKEIKTDGVVPELENNFDNLIVYNARKNLIGSDKYQHISSSDEYTLHNPINDEEMKNLKYLKDDVRLTIRHEDYANAFKVIDIVTQLKPEATITVKVNDKNLFNMFAFSNINEMVISNVYIDCNSSRDKISFIDYLKYEKRLMEMVKPAMNLSPFEKYLFAYNITKKFKKYKENHDDKSSSRTLYDLLDNEYMVCVGYATLLGDLLDKLGIPSADYSITLDVMYDGIPTDIEYIPNNIIENGREKSFELEKAYHARRFVHLVDDKYGIDGMFVADPTWDNSLVNDYYVYSLMSPNETVGDQRYLFLNFFNVDELVFVNNIEEFFYKVNVWLDRNSQKKYETAEKSFVRSMFDFVKKIDVSFYTYLSTKYSDFLVYNADISKEKFANFVTDVGEYFVSKCNYVLDGNLLKSGITEVYRKCYGYDDPEKLDEKVNSVMEINKTKYDRNFPKRFKVLPDGTKEVYENEINKFDISSNLIVDN